MTDERYGIPTVRVLEAQAPHGPTWRYRFDGPTPGYSHKQWGVHGADVTMVWGLGVSGASADVRELSQAMQESWVSFISHGTPEARGLPMWPRYAPPRRATMLLDIPARVEDDPDGGDRSLWDGVAWQPGTWWPLR
jgi:para-nitrobenzyl esterase